MSFGPDVVWKALADPTRREVLDSLRSGPRTTGDLCCRFKGRLARTAVMKHLGILEAAGLVLVRRTGRFRWNYLNPVPIEQVCRRWVDRYTAERAASLLRLRERVEGEGLKARKKAHVDPKVDGEEPRKIREEVEILFFVP